MLDIPQQLAAFRAERERRFLDVHHVVIPVQDTDTFRRHTGQHLGAVCRHNELYFRKRPDKIVDNGLLPGRMQVHIHLVDQDHTGGFQGDVFPHVRIETGHSVGYIRRHADYTAGPIAHGFQRKFTHFGMADQQVLRCKAVFQIGPAHTADTGNNRFFYFI